MREKCRALLIDFDGVLRYFSIERLAAVEERHGLRAGALLEIALHHSLLFPLSEGVISHAEWEEKIAEAITEFVWADSDDSALVRAREAVTEWQADRGIVDAAVLDFVREVRAAGLPVALCTNATDRLSADLVELGLEKEFDVVVNSSAIGFRKPDKEYFRAAALAVRVPPKECLFLDDADRNISGARTVGMAAYRFTGVHDLQYVRAALAI